MTELSVTRSVNKRYESGWVLGNSLWNVAAHYFGIQISWRLGFGHWRSCNATPIINDHEFWGRVEGSRVEVERLSSDMSVDASSVLPHLWRRWRR
jgi:hypothetical protein